MQPTIKVDYSAFTVMARELAAYSPISLRQVLKLETASVIKIAALNAKIASSAAIKKQVDNFGKHYYSGPGGAVVIVNFARYPGRVWFSYFQNTTGPSSGSRRSGIRGVGAFMVYNGGGSKGWHLEDIVWYGYLDVVAARDQANQVRYKELLKRRGLQRLSWLQIGDQLGVPLSVVSPNGNLQEAIARAARGPGGKNYSNGRATVTLTTSALTITVENSSPLAIKNQGQAGLDRAVAQRLKGFEIAMNKGLLTDLKARAARWKGVFVYAA